MHSYLKAIGISNLISKRQLSDMVEKLPANQVFTDKMVYNDVEIVEKTARFGNDFGIIILGTMNGNEFDIDYYYPYANGMVMGTFNDLSLERQIEDYCYKGVCEDIRVGVSLIFHVQNSFSCFVKRMNGEKISRCSDICFTGISTDGKILFPLNIGEQAKKKRVIDNLNRNILIMAAKQGDENAIESLTMEEFDTNSMINKRIKEEDVFSIVDSTFIPYGIQCDRYTIIGDIKKVSESVNEVTGEKLYKFVITCNDIPITIQINKEDLLGEPLPGRRFKGVIWLQGRIS